MCVLGICQIELISYSTWQKATYHVEPTSLIAPEARTRLERLASTRRSFPNEALANKSPWDTVAGTWVMID